MLKIRFSGMKTISWSSRIGFLSLISPSPASQTCFLSNDFCYKSEQIPILNIIMLISDSTESLSASKILLLAGEKVLFGTGIYVWGIRNHLFSNGKTFSSAGDPL